MIYAGYVKVAPGKQQTGPVKLKISPGTGEAKFSLSETKKVLWVGFHRVFCRGVFLHKEVTYKLKFPELSRTPDL